MLLCGGIGSVAGLLLICYVIHWTPNLESDFFEFLDF